LWKSGAGKWHLQFHASLWSIKLARNRRQSSSSWKLCRQKLPPGHASCSGGLFQLSALSAPRSSFRTVPWPDWQAHEQTSISYRSSRLIVGQGTFPLSTLFQSCKGLLFERTVVRRRASKRTAGLSFSSRRYPRRSSKGRTACVGTREIPLGWPASSTLFFSHELAAACAESFCAAESPRGNRMNNEVWISSSAHSLRGSLADGTAPGDNIPPSSLLPSLTFRVAVLLHTSRTAQHPAIAKPTRMIRMEPEARDLLDFSLAARSDRALLFPFSPSLLFSQGTCRPWPSQ